MGCIFLCVVAMLKKKGCALFCMFNFFLSFKNLLGFYCTDSTVTRQGPGPERVCLGPVVVCAFLYLCRKDFTTRVQVIMKMHFFEAGDSETRKGLA